MLITSPDVGRNGERAAETVSVIVPFLDGERFLDEAIRSVLAQTYLSWELLLVDDGSSDASTAIAHRYVAEMPERIKYFEHPGHINKGQSASRNLGIANARGIYIAFLDADDIWLPEKLETQVSLLEANPEAAMVYGPLYFWYEWTGDSQQTGRDFLCCMGTNHDVLVPPPEMLLRQIETRDGLPGTCSVLLRRAAVDKVGGFEETFPGMYEDEVFFAKIALRFPVYINSQSLDRYRQHTDSFCARAIRTGEYSMDPTIQNPSRQRFLRWLERHIAASGLDDGTLLRALGVQLRADPK